MATLTDIVSALDEELQPGRFPGDPSRNGLQVANSGEVRKVRCGVDGSLEFFERAAAEGADLCIVHHGISWGDSLTRIAGLNYELVSFLMKHDMALYACHLPLDAHPTLGNNAGLAGALGLRDLRPFGEYAGSLIGFWGELAAPVPATEFRERVRALSNGGFTAHEYGPVAIRTVGVVSGGGEGELPQAAALGLDAFVSGEGGLQAYNAAKQGRIHAYFAGHYATETFGVKSLGRFVAERFGIEAEFIDFRLPW